MPAETRALDFCAGEAFTALVFLVARHRRSTRVVRGMVCLRRG
jgi:hypothetical protein